MYRILFVCTGNTCRSPMAQALLQRKVQEAGLQDQIEVRSAGLMAMPGLKASPGAQRAMKTRNIPLHKHRSKPFDNADAAWADLILTMTQGHKRLVIERFPESVHRAYTVKEYMYDSDQHRSMLDEVIRLQTEVETKRALSQDASEDIRRLEELAADMPGFDIQDPFGGSDKMYEACANELTECIDKIIDKLLQDGIIDQQEQ